MRIKEVFEELRDVEKIERKLDTIAEFYGVVHQLKKLNEEVYELTEAILLRDLGADAVAEEFADVLVLLTQIAELENIDVDKVRKTIAYKVDRQIKRVMIEESELDE